MNTEIIYKLKVVNTSRKVSSWTRYFQNHPTIEQILKLYKEQEEWTWSILELTPDQLKNVLEQDENYVFWPFEKEIWGREDFFTYGDMDFNVSVSMIPLFKN